MRKNNRARAHSRNKLAKLPDGKIKDLPETGGTTMWHEKSLRCPNFKHHNITGSTMKVYCYDCGLWWNR